MMNKAWHTQCYIIFFWLKLRSSSRYSPTSVLPPDSFCSSHPMHLFLTLWDKSCTGSRDVRSPQIQTVHACTQVPTQTRSSLPVWILDARNDEIICDTWMLLSISRTKTKMFGPRGFYFALSAALNALPVHLRDPELSLSSFKIKLKTNFLLGVSHLGHI